MLLVCLMGPACAGKTTTITTVLEAAPGKVRAVEVGKRLRAKYGASHFKGQGNPKHTADEAWQLCVDGVREAEAAGAMVCLVDGQPRDIPQVDLMSGDAFAAHTVAYVLLTCDAEESRRRAALTRSGDSLELAMARIKNDREMYFDVLARLLQRGKRIRVIDTTSGYRPEQMVGIINDMLNGDSVGECRCA